MTRVDELMRAYAVQPPAKPLNVPTVPLAVATMTEAEERAWEMKILAGQYVQLSEPKPPKPRAPRVARAKTPRPKREPRAAENVVEWTVLPKPEPTPSPCAACEPTEAHSHRWRVGEPTGPTSHGECACGATREFPNAYVLDRPDDHVRQRTIRLARKGITA